MLRIHDVLEHLFDPKLFLAKVGEGRTLAAYSRNQMVYSQGDPANAVFYIQKGKVKLTVVSNAGKEAIRLLSRTAGEV